MHGFYQIFKKPIKCMVPIGYFEKTDKNACIYTGDFEKPDS